MAPDTFHQFAFLPFELRRMIYLFASPPRFVHVREHHEDREAFEERFRTTPVQLTLHPSIAYFARNWRSRIPWSPSRWRRYYRHHQLTLDTYGFSCSRPNHQPWESTEEVPGIPHHFLSENPEVAWEFVRSGSFYSTAPIPTLLHVTRESRQVLIDYGYELAFRTRTCGPHVWFNFKTDILYIGMDWNDRSYHYLLSGNESWDIGQYDPLDLKRVRRLALNSSGKVVSLRYQTGVEDISSILELFTGIEEMFLEEPGLDSLRSDFPRINDSNLWCYTPVLEVDVLSSVFAQEEMLYSTGDYHGDLWQYKAENMGDGAWYFADVADEFKEKLTLRRDQIVRRESLAQWRIPEINIVYIGYPSMCRNLFKWRLDSWNRYQALKEERSRSSAAEEAHRSIDVPKRPLYHNDDNSPPSPFSEQFRDDIEVLEDIILLESQMYDHSGEEFYRSRYERLFTVTIAPPEME
ncbi:hypothetical protein F4859DRAFT_470685 [Xylaria cf. heliscus]|nr:hypothetical protein F4859DRAFT_470685 [Xylaria cf. heliscus]